MPVHFSKGPFLEMLLGGCNVVTLRQVRDDLLAGPATLQEPHLGVGEAPFQIWNDAVVRSLLPQVVGVLEVKLFVRASYNGIGVG